MHGSMNIKFTMMGTGKPKTCVKEKKTGNDM